ncbi:MAG: hypothetical protein AAGH79_00330 [Bacteroidota bacterium]
MKKYIYTLLLCLGLGSAWAQVTPPVNVTNASAIAQEITDLFGSNINVTTTQITTFFTDELVNQAPGCGYPDGQMVNYDATSAQFAWTPVPGAQKYFLHYMNLLTGVTGHESFSPGDPLIVTGLPDGLYLFTFQNACGPQSRGALGIIIADKDIMITIGPNFDCRCKRLGQSMIADDFQLPAPAQFLLVLDDTNNGEDEDAILEFSTTLVETPLGDQVAAQIYPFCGAQGIMTEDHGIFYPAFDPTGTIYINDGHLELDLNASVDVFLRTCKPSNPQNANLRNQRVAGTGVPSTPSILPNPVRSTYTILGPSSKTGYIQYSWLSMDGQILWNKRVSVSTEEPWKISDHFPTGYAPGLYLLQIEQDGERTFHKVIRQ